MKIGNSGFDGLADRSEQTVYEARMSSLGYKSPGLQPLRFEKTIQEVSI